MTVIYMPKGSVAKFFSPTFHPSQEAPPPNTPFPTFSSFFILLYKKKTVQ